MKQKTKSNPAEQHNELIHFEFNDPIAATVSIAGTFNNWVADAMPMTSLGAGRWVKELALPPGTYEYLLVVDGKWITDPNAKQTAPNPFGGMNSVLTVKSPGKDEKKSGAFSLEGIAHVVHSTPPRVISGNRA